MVRRREVAEAISWASAVHSSLRAEWRRWVSEGGEGEGELALEREGKEYEVEDEEEEGREGK